MSRPLLAGCGLSAAIVASTLSLTGCSTADAPPATAAPVAHVQSATTPALPSAQEVTELFARMLDPAIPNSDKIDSVQGIADDPGLPNRLAESPGRHGARITVTITSTRLGAPGMLAEGTAIMNDLPPHPVIVNFVAEDGEWKIEKAWYCQVAFSFMVASPSCPG
ncbi:hypothetical protein ACFVVM_19845 [Nocardia sp. NPDC058176]|uniref:hypothetical protein n=1 Tax=Nocardia sp. NPDC058176 TaxID=3346368 RepID=UPI0036DBC69E